MMKWVAVFLCLVVGCVLGQATLHFNSTWEQACLAGCNFNEAQIWVPPQVPGANDIVIVNFTSGSQAFLIINSTTQVSFLVLTNSSVVVEAANLTLDQIDVGANSNFNATKSSQISIVNPQLFTGNVTLSDSSVLIANNSTGTIGFNSLALKDTSVLQAATSTCYFQEGSLLIEENANINCAGITLSSVQQVEILQTLNISMLRVSWGSYVLNNGVAAGLVSVQGNSSLTIGNSFTAQVNVSTSSTLTLLNVLGAVINSHYSPADPALLGTGNFELVESSASIVGNQAAPSFGGMISGAGTSSLIANNFQVANLVALQVEAASKFTIYGSLNVTQNLMVYNSTIILQTTNLVAAGILAQTQGVVQVIGNGNVTVGVKGCQIDNSSSISLINNSTFFASSIDANGGILVQDTATLSATNMSLYGAVNLAGNATLTGSTCDLYGTFESEQNARFYCDWATFSLKSANIQSLFSTAGYLYINGSLNLPNGLFSGYTKVNPNGNLTVSTSFQTQLFVDANATVFLVDCPTSVIRVYLSLSPAIEGTGTLEIINSLVNVSGASSDPTFDGSIVLAGQSTLYARNLTLGSLNTATYNGTTNNVSVWGNGFEVKGSSNFAGQVWAFGETTFSGKNIVLTGPVDVLPGGNLEVSGQVVLNGNISNSGTVTAHTGALAVVGNYNSNENSTLVADLSSSSTPAIAVNGSMFLNGALQYSLGKQLKSQNFYVATTNGGKIEGKFVGDASPASGSDVKQALAVIYSDTQIYVKYSLSIHDLPAWIWVIVAVGGAVLIAAIVGVVILIRRRKARKGYDPVF